MLNIVMFVIFVLSVAGSIVYIVYHVYKQTPSDNFSAALPSMFVIALAALVVLLLCFTCNPSSGTHCVKKIARSVDNEVDVLLAIDGRGIGGWVTIDKEELGKIKERDCVEYIRSFWFGMRSIKYIPGNCCTDIKKDYHCNSDDDY